MVSLGTDRGGGLRELEIKSAVVRGVDMVARGSIDLLCSDDDYLQDGVVSFVCSRGEELSETGSLFGG